MLAMWVQFYLPSHFVENIHAVIAFCGPTHIAVTANASDGHGACTRGPQIGVILDHDTGVAQVAALARSSSRHIPC